MVARETLELYFLEIDDPRLARTVLRDADMNRVEPTVALWSEMAAPGARSFRWTRGVKSLCLALLRLSARGEDARHQPLLSGGRGSAAGTLDSLIYKADSLAWPADVLTVSCSDSAQKRLLRWFERRNSQFNDPQRPVRVFARNSSTGLLAGDVLVFLDDRPAIDEEVGAIARLIAAEFDE